MVKDSEVIEYNDVKRNFKYRLNDKIAKAKMMKGAKRVPYNVEYNSSSCNFMFNLGSWAHVSFNPQRRDLVEQIKLVGTVL